MLYSYNQTSICSQLSFWVEVSLAECYYYEGPMQTPPGRESLGLKAGGY